MSIRLEEREGIAVVTLDRPPANALNVQLVAELRRALSEARDARAVLLTSNLPNMFCAGWDLPELISFGREEMAAFLDSFCDLVAEIFALRAPLIAALPGHAIAGGLIVAAAADERYAARGPAQFGLSEVVLGVPVPRCCLEIFRHLLGDRGAERLAATGENQTADGAAEIGLIDRVFSREELFDRAFERARFLASRPGPPYAAIKLRARADALARYGAARPDDPFLDWWFDADARQRIGELVAKLGKK